MAKKTATSTKKNVKAEKPSPKAKATTKKRVSTL